MTNRNTGNEHLRNTALSERQSAGIDQRATDLNHVAQQFGNRLEAAMSARRLAQQALQESERRYREFFENAQDAIYVHDLKGRYTLVNKAGEQLLGYTNEELLQMTIFDVVPSDHVEKIRENLSKKLAGHVPTIYEVEALAKDGRRVPVEVNSRLIFEQGVPVGVQGTARDISERRRSEEALRESEERFRTVTETASDAILVIDEAGTIKLANPAAEKIFGYTIAEMLNQNLSMLMPEHIRAAHHSALVEYLSGDESLESAAVELTGLHRSGREVPIELSFAEFTKLGKRFFTGIARDITERKQSQAAVKASEERFSELVENANDIIFTCDMSGNFTSLNRAGEQLTGYSRADAMKINFADVVAPECLALARQMLERKTVEEGAAVYELEIVTRCGRRATLEVSSLLLRSGGKCVGVQGIARDTTERKLAVEALRASQTQLQQSQKLEAIGQLAGGVAHDFNNLLTAIIGYSDLALRQLNAENPVERYVVEVKKAAQRAASLICQLLAFSRKQILEPKVLELNFVVGDMNRLLRRLIGEDIVLVTSLAGDLGRVKADPGQIEQIIMNLVVNARDAMPTGGNVTIETANVDLDGDYGLAHMPTEPGQYVMLAISDTGMGMEPETQARIFEPFFTTKEVGKGTGLGLSTVYGIVKQSGGYVWVYSELNRGTTFKVYLPRVDALAPETKLAVGVADSARGWETVLLVEDEESVRSVAREILESSGYRILETRDVDEAIRTCAEYPEIIHLALTDVIMPKMGGREFADRVRSMRPGMKVLFMSGYTDEAVVLHGVLDSSINFIQKPFSPVVLARKIRDVLDS